VVIADLSTSNANAIYELGVRHALRPYTTIVMAEKQFKFPFDIGHLLIRSYEHLGKGIDAEEAERVREELKKAIQTLIEKQEVDSPVHTFLPHLAQPKGSAKSVIEAPSVESVADNTVVATDPSASELMTLFKEARADSNWRAATRLLKRLLVKMPTDEYLNQQLALATYKSKQPDTETALFEAKAILQTLNPENTTNAETLGLWGAVHKRLWEIKAEAIHLEAAIWAYEKGFYLKDDYYNGINFAFLLNVRASISERREAIADFVTAERIRRRVIPICEELLAKGIKDDEGNPDKEQEFWVQATLVEALNGIGERQKAQEGKAAAIAKAPEPWMVDSMNEQLEKLEGLLANAPAV
jgi:tetratricopeptide (TPR) repeat protein